MSDQYWLTKAQLKRIETFFPRTRGIPRPPRAKRRLLATYCKTLYRQHHKVENKFAKLKKIGGVSQCATTAVPTHSSALSASRQPLSFGSVNES